MSGEFAKTDTVGGWRSVGRAASTSENRQRAGLSRATTLAMLPDPAACYAAILARDARFDGRFFCGVKTTGIYCRPVCPARPPRPENCTFHPSAAAAQAAGFRPCLRCRPETAPDMGAWRGASNTVSRALALIEAGALDEGSVEQLSDRMGVGARQLTRLFRQHLGASPNAVAQTRRVLLARRLISDTSLEMTQVALASGFGSVRRFNETFQQLYGRPPGSLRSARRQTAASPSHSADAATAMWEGRGASLALILPTRPPYDWEAMLSFLATHATPGVETTEGGVHRRTISTDQGPGWLEVAPAPEGTGAEVTVHLPSLKPLASVIARVRVLFDLAADPVAIGEALSADPTLAALVTARPGLRVPGAWDGFELAVRTVLGQQVSVSAGTRLAGKLVEVFGEPLATSPALGLTHLFPTPERLAEVDIAALGLMPGARARAISSLARSVIADSSLLRPGRSLDQSVERLCAVPGIGPWTAQYVAMRALRESDAFMPTDVGLQRAAADEAGLRPTPAELSARAEAWRPWRSYACLHLWTGDASNWRPKETRDAA